MTVCADGWIDLELQQHQLILRAGDHTLEAEETVTLQSDGLDASLDPSVIVRLNPAYVAPMLRCAGIELAYREPAEGEYVDPPVVFTAAGADWRYMVMGMRRD